YSTLKNSTCRLKVEFFIITPPCIFAAQKVLLTGGGDVEIWTLLAEGRGQRPHLEKLRFSIAH
ncbi:MAG: hypothetical protein R3Y04_09795, partial [Rikenellaceae bacterium]